MSSISFVPRVWCVSSSRSAFLPGARRSGLTLLCAVWAFLLVLRGSDSGTGDDRRRAACFSRARRGAGLWINVPFGAIVLLVSRPAAFLAWWSRLPTRTR